MNIKDFVRQSLVEISRGLREAQREGVAINPSPGGKAATTTRVAFSLNVECEAKGGASLKVVGGEVGKTLSNRIDFAVDAALTGAPPVLERPRRPAYGAKVDESRGGGAISSES